MPINKRTAVRNPQAFIEDQAIRLSLRVGLQKLEQERQSELEFPSGKTDTALMNLDRKIAFVQAKLKEDGLFQLVIR
jgi:hypothetical protein